MKHPHALSVLLVWAAGMLEVDVVQADIVTASVTSISGRSVYLDRGRGAGVAPGMHVRLFPPGAQPIDAIVVTASTSSARVDLPIGQPLPPIGCRAEFDVPAAPPDEPTPARDAPPATAPDHPPWSRPEEARSPDLPLLSPAFSKPPKDRPMTFSGRVYTQLQYSGQEAGGINSHYSLMRTGTSFEVGNLLRDGGRLYFDGEMDYRTAASEFYDEDQANMILYRLSYVLGGQDYAPYRLEFGRFYSYYLPDIGTVDGVEAALCLKNGLSIGAGGGGYPDLTPDSDWGTNYGFHLFLDYQSTGNRPLSATLGYLKTWHDSAPDRDAVFASVNWMATPQLWFYGSCTLDIYGSGELVKSSGVELTEAWLQARYAPDSHKGVSLSYSRYTWADVKFSEFEFAPIELIEDGLMDRLELNGWLDISKGVRLDGNVYYFSNQDSDGMGGEVGVDWTLPLKAPIVLHGDVFHTDGTYVDGTGFHLELRPTIGPVQAYLGYEFFAYSNAGLINGDSELRQSIIAGVSWQIGNWFYSLTADDYFGDVENAYSLGLYAEYRF